MDEKTLIGILSTGGTTGALLWIIWKVGMALVGSVKDLRTEVAEHTKIDLAHHAKVSEELAELSGRIEGIAFERERTPVEVPVPRAKAQGSTLLPTTYSVPRRGPRDDER